MTKNLTQLSYYLGAVYGDREMKMDQTSLRSILINHLKWVKQIGKLLEQYFLIE